MSNMEILSIFLLTLSLAAAQHRPHNRNPGFRNPGFRNVRTPLATSATRDRPFISIPIVLLPDGQALPKPKHSTYHYVGHGAQRPSRQNNQRNNKSRGSMAGKPTSNYQVVIPPQMPALHQKKTVKPPKVTVSQLNSHLRNSQSFPKHRGQNQNAQQNQPQKPHQTFEQTQQMHQIQYQKQQQRNTGFQQQGNQQSQQTALHKQNLANFVNFATNLGSAINAQQQNQQIILPTQTPIPGLTFQNQPNLKVQENFASQKSLLSNHKLNNGIMFQHQVPSLQTTQVHFAQVVPNNLANHNLGFSVNKQQLSQSQTSTQPQQQQIQQTQTSPSPSPENQYLSASNIRSNSQSVQGTGLQNNIQYSSNQAAAYQQNSGTNLRAPSSQGNVALLNNFNNQVQQNNQQNYATSTTPQQPTPAPQIVSNYDSQQQVTKNILSGQQSTGEAEYTLNHQPSQNNFANQNQVTQQQNYNVNTEGQQITLSNNAQTSSVSYPNNQVTQENAFSLQNMQTNTGQINDPSSYFQYQTAQDYASPLNYASLFNQGQASYLSSNQNIQQNNSPSSPVVQSYTILPSNQNVFASSSIPTIYVSPQQDETASNNSPSESEIQTYESYSSDQSAYPTSINQASQGSFITQNIDKGYPFPQMSFLQSSSGSQASSSSDSQLSQSSPSVSSEHLLYTSSSPKQITFSQSETSFSSPSQQYSSSNYQSSPTYVAFSTANSNIKSESQPSLNYGQRATGVVTPGTTYAKLSQNEAKQSESSETSSDSDDSEYDEDEETDDEEASYKVVYIPLDILKNILSNSVENQ